MKQPTNPKEIKSELLAIIRKIEHELMYNKKTKYTLHNLKTATYQFLDIPKNQTDEPTENEI